MTIKEKIKENINSKIKGYDYKKYWTRRDKVFNEKVPYLLRIYYKFYCRRVDAKNEADINIILECGDNFSSHPVLPHGIKGIVIAGGAKIGKNVTISHQVTIGRSRYLAPKIGNNVYIGPGAKIFGGISVGNNVRIGANCVVFEDIPDNATVVLAKPRVIVKDPEYDYYVYDENRS